MPPHSQGRSLAGRRRRHPPPSFGLWVTSALGEATDGPPPSTKHDHTRQQCRCRPRGSDQGGSAFEGCFCHQLEAFRKQNASTQGLPVPKGLSVVEDAEEPQPLGKGLGKGGGLVVLPHLERCVLGWAGLGWAGVFWQLHTWGGGEGLQGLGL